MTEKIAIVGVGASGGRESPRGYITLNNTNYWG